MVFLKKGRDAPSAWWLVPAGVVLLVVGLVMFVLDGGYQGARWGFSFLVGGPALIIFGIVCGLKGGRIDR